MTETPAISIYESTFAESDKTDAILHIEGEKENPKKPRPLFKIDSVPKEGKLHVNKAILSYHSPYFKSLFNSKDKSEYAIEDVNFKEFATLLSLVPDKPITFGDNDVEKLLELAERFQLPAAKNHVELFMISRDTFKSLCSTEIAEKYNLKKVMKRVLDEVTSDGQYFDHNYPGRKPRFHLFDKLSDKTNVVLFEKLMKVMYK